MQFLIVEALTEGIRLEDRLQENARELAASNAQAIADTHAQLNQVLAGGGR